MSGHDGKRRKSLECCGRRPALGALPPETGRFAWNETGILCFWSPTCVLLFHLPTTAPAPECADRTKCAPVFAPGSLDQIGRTAWGALLCKAPRTISNRIRTARDRCPFAAAERAEDRGFSCVAKEDGRDGDRARPG